MAHLQYMPGDPRLVDQLVYELKSKGIFDQFRKECIADVDTRPAYQNLRQRVENSVSTFLSRQCWKPDLNKNQLREKLRKHILEGNYLEQGVERIVDQVVNPKVASVFIPQVEDLVYNYLGITRKKSEKTAQTSNGNSDDLLPTDLEAVSPGSVKSNDDKNETIDVEMTEDSKDTKMEIDETDRDVKDESSSALEVIDKERTEHDTQISGISELTINDSNTSIDKGSIPLPSQEISLENIPAPENSPPKQSVDLEKIQLPQEPNLSTDIPLPDEVPKAEKDNFFKPANSDDDESSSDSSLRRNMSPLTPIRNFNNENSCDAQQAFENDSDSKTDEKKEPSSFRFTIEAKRDNSKDGAKTEKKDPEKTDLSYQFNSQVNINTFNTPLYEDSSNSNNLHIDYESDVNSKMNTESKLPEGENSEDSKKDKKVEDKKSSQKISHRSRDSSRHTNSKDRRYDSKHSSRDSSRHDRKSSKDESKSKSSNKERERSRDRSEKKDSRDTSKHRSSHKSCSNRNSKSSSHRSSSSSQKHSSKHLDDKKSSGRDKTSDSSKSRDKSKESKSSQRSDKDQKDKKSKKDEKDKKKDKKDTDDHYSLSGRGNHTRRSTDRDSNDGSTSSKGSSNPNTKSTESKKESKGSSKSDNTSPCGESTSPSDREHTVKAVNPNTVSQARPIVRVDNHLEVPIAAPPRLPFVPDVTLKKPKFAANFEEAKRLMKMRKFLDEEQKRMNQEAALLLEFQANVRPSLSQVYSSIPGPELEFACVTNSVGAVVESQPSYEITIEPANIENRQMTVQEIENIIGVNISDGISGTFYDQDSGEDVAVKSDDQTTENVSHSSIKEIENYHPSEVNVENEMSQTSTEPEKPTERKAKIKESNDNDNKPFSDIIDEITKYKNASDSKMNLDKEDASMEKLHDDDNKKRTEFFEITIITEELSETEDTDNSAKKDVPKAMEGKSDVNINNNTIETLGSPDSVVSDSAEPIPNNPNQPKVNDEYKLEYFGETEKYNAELERDQFGGFLKRFIENTATSRMYLINCDKYEERIIKEVSEAMGRYETVSYYKNGHLKLAKNVVKNINLVQEVSLPVESIDSEKSSEHSPIFSPVKSECSFELSSEYDAKLEEMVNKTSRQEVMEIILGAVIDESPSEMPKIDYCNESSIESGDLKRKCEETNVNNNTQVLTPHKIRKLSESDQISSTTEETEEVSHNKAQNNTRSKYLGRARRVGLPRPRKTTLPNSPSSDKSVENYEQNAPTPQTPNGKLKSTPRNKIQRYDTSDLYKPKLHYLSRRNNIT